MLEILTAALSPLINRASLFLSETSHGIIANIANSYYRYISMVDGASPAFAIFEMLVYGFYILSFFLVFDYANFDTWKSLKFRLVWSLTIFAGIFAAYAYQKAAYQESSRLHANVEILSPYVSDLEYKQMKSALYSIDGKDDYLSLVTMMDTLASDNSVNLRR